MGRDYDGEWALRKEDNLIGRECGALMRPRFYTVTVNAVARWSFNLAISGSSSYYNFLCLLNRSIASIRKSVTYPFYRSSRWIILIQWRCKVTENVLNWIHRSFLLYLSRQLDYLTIDFFDGFDPVPKYGYDAVFKITNFSFLWLIAYLSTMMHEQTVMQFSL